MKNIKIITTLDGSLGLYNLELDEVYHSKFGAATEAKEKFIEPCLILNDRPLKILDICYGVGYNTKMALEVFNDIKLIDCIEINPELVKLSAEFPFKSDILKKDFIHFYIEDLRSAIKKLDKKYDIIFHDGFSPLKESSVWSEDIIFEIAKRLKGLYVTYNHSKPVLAALKRAGLYLGKTIKDNKTIGTVASFDSNLILNPLDKYELGMLNTKSAITYKDRGLNLSHEKILLNRRLEVESSNLMSLSSYKRLAKK